MHDNVLATTRRGGLPRFVTHRTSVRVILSVRNVPFVLGQVDVPSHGGRAEPRTPDQRAGEQAKLGGLSARYNRPSECRP